MEGRVFRKRYLLKSRLGSGSFGTAWLVADERRKGEEYVMKQIFIGMLEPDETVDALREARLLGQLKHPNIVALCEAFMEEQFVCIVTEYCEGGDLDERIKATARAGQTLAQRQVLLWLVQLAMALRYLHERRILHRDLKTKNVFLRKGIVKLGDFGIARVLMGTHDEAHTFAGTPYFMSPEALQSAGYSSKSDIWSLGCVLFEMCSLKRAFDSEGLMGLMYQICEGEPPAIPADHYDGSLRSLATSLLQRDPRQRPSAQQILQLPFIVSMLEGMQFSLSQHTDRSLSLLQHEKKRIRGAMSRGTPPVEEQPQQHEQEPGTPLTPRQRAALRKQRAADRRAEELRDALQQADGPARAVRPGSGGRRGQSPQCRQQQASGVEDLIYGKGQAASRSGSASSMAAAAGREQDALPEGQQRALRPIHREGAGSPQVDGGTGGGAGDYANIYADGAWHQRIGTNPGQMAVRGSYVPSAMDAASPGPSRSGASPRSLSSLSSGSHGGVTVASPLSREGTAESLLLSPSRIGGDDGPESHLPRLESPRFASGTRQELADEFLGEGAASPRRSRSGRHPSRSPVGPRPPRDISPATPHWVREHPEIFKDWAPEPLLDSLPQEQQLRRGSRHSRDEVILPVSELEDNAPPGSPQGSVQHKRPSTSQSVQSFGDSRVRHSTTHHEHKRTPPPLGNTMDDLSGSFGSDGFSVSFITAATSAEADRSQLRPALQEDAIAKAESMYLAEEFEEAFSSSDEQDMLDMQQCMADVLSSPAETANELPETNDPDPLRVERMAHLRKEGQRLLGGKFLGVYQYLLEARKSKVKEQVIKSRLMSMTDQYRDCFVVDQLVYMECFT